MVYNCIKFIQSACYPSYCLLCDTSLEPETDICPGCLAELPFNRQACCQCGLPLSSNKNQVCGRCIRHPPPFTATQVPLRYEAPVNRLVGALKFRHQLHLASPLGRLFCRQLPRNHPLPDIILPVPLHPQRLRERGFNQSLELARSVASGLGLPLVRQGCRRVIATPPQSGLDQRGRMKNLRKAFVADARVEGLHIALFDDVITTGATVTAVSQVLLRAGAKRIDVWALARTPLP